jgi:hypothetical protein
MQPSHSKQHPMNWNQLLAETVPAERELTYIVEADGIANLKTLILRFDANGLDMADAFMA